MRLMRVLGHIQIDSEQLLDPVPRSKLPIAFFNMQNEGLEGRRSPYSANQRPPRDS